MVGPLTPFPATRAVFAALVVFVLFVAACSSGTEEADPDAPGIVPTLTPDPRATAIADLSEPEFEGVVIDPFDLDISDCFNTYIWRDRAQNLQRATTRVGCQRNHQAEAYWIDEHPAPEDQPYVGEDELKAFTQEVCFENFEDFVGTEYVQSALEIRFLYPDLQAWNSENARTVLCYLEAWEGGLLRGSMAGVEL